MDKECSHERTFAKWWALFWTCIYTVLTPFFFYISLLSAMIFASPRMTVPVGIFFMFLVFCVPVSMIASIYLMWSNYFRAEYQRINFLWALPILTVVAVVVLNAIAQSLFL